MSETKHLIYPIDFHSISFPTMEVNGGSSTVWLQTFFKISSFVLSRRKTFIKVWYCT